MDGEQDFWIFLGNLPSLSGKFHTILLRLLVLINKTNGVGNLAQWQSATAKRVSDRKCPDAPNIHSGEQLTDPTSNKVESENKYLRLYSRPPCI